MKNKQYGVCIVFSSSYESDKARVVLSMADLDFGMIGVHEGIDDVEYFYYNKAYDIEDMAKVVKPVVERYKHYIQSVHYFTMVTQDMQEYLQLQGDRKEAHTEFNDKEVVQSYRRNDNIGNVIELKLLSIRSKDNPVSCWRVEEYVNQHIKCVANYPDGVDRAYRHFDERKRELDRG